MQQLWLTCPECGEPGTLLCEVRGPLPQNLILVYQDCTCEYPEDAWDDVWEESREKLQALAEEKAE